MDNMAKEKNSTLHYQNYLRLDKVLDAQNPMSKIKGDSEAHDEMLFIITHQVYELWFKQIIHELNSVIDLFKTEKIDESNIPVAVGRLNRVIEIEKVLIDQIRILETMTPLDFLEFRKHLFPASGFQSFQFRLVESMMGLSDSTRIKYGNTHYKSPFSEDQSIQLEYYNEFNMFYLIESWLERTPFLQFGDFEFLKHYKDAVDTMFNSELNEINNSELITGENKSTRKEMLEKTRRYYDSLFDEKIHSKLRDDGQINMSYKASVAALLINIYRDEPLLHHPFRLLTCLIDMDELFTTWRYRHSQMVLRMLGRKMGTGGSSGYDYLHKTAVSHSIFSDLHNVSTLLVPRHQLPELPENIKKELGFYYTANK